MIEESRFTVNVSDKREREAHFFCSFSSPVSMVPNQNARAFLSRFVLSSMLPSPPPDRIIQKCACVVESLYCCDRRIIITSEWILQIARAVLNRLFPRFFLSPLPATGSRKCRYRLRNPIGGLLLLYPSRFLRPPESHRSSIELWHPLLSLAFFVAVIEQAHTIANSNNKNNDKLVLEPSFSSWMGCISDGRR